MQLIATARFQKAHSKTLSARPYTEKIMEMVSHLSKYAEGTHPLLTTPETIHNIALLIITSNRGLCGGFNASILRSAQRFLEERKADGQNVIIDVAGKKGIGHLKFLSISTEKEYLLPDEVPYSRVEELAERYIDLFTRGQVDAVAVAYMRFYSSSKQKPYILQLLPLQLPEVDEELPVKRYVNYEYIPSPAEIFDNLIPEAIKVALYQCFMESNISEQAARMVAMKSATDNAEEMVKRLTKQANKARQTQITRELSELMSGAEALK